MEDLAYDGGQPVRSEQLSFASPVVGDDEVEKVAKAMRSGWLTTGQRTEEFETMIADRVGAKYAIGTTNCTSALYLSFRSLDITGEVITSPNTFASTVSSGLMAGVTPVLADIRTDTLTLDPASVKEAISNETEAIVPVHYAGQAMDMDAILDLAVDHDLAVIEDAAHGFGGYYRGEALGTLGDIGCYSFYASKSITTSEGGMIVTDNQTIAEQSRRLRSAGINQSTWDRPRQKQPDWHYEVIDVSGKYNMTDIQASIGLAQIKKLDHFIECRQELAEQYDSRLSSLDVISPLFVRDRSEHARHIYPVIIATDELDIDRSEFSELLRFEGIDTSVHYIPIHHHTAFANVDRVALPQMDKIANRILSLPLHPTMTSEDIEDVSKAIRKVIHHS